MSAVTWLFLATNLISAGIAMVVFRRQSAAADTLSQALTRETERTRALAVQVLELQHRLDLAERQQSWAADTTTPEPAQPGTVVFLTPGQQPA